MQNLFNHSPFKGHLGFFFEHFAVKNKAAMNYVPLFIIKELKKNMFFVSKDLRNLNYNQIEIIELKNYRTKKPIMKVSLARVKSRLIWQKRVNEHEADPPPKKKIQTKEQIERLKKNEQSIRDTRRYQII